MVPHWVSSAEEQLQGQLLQHLSPPLGPRGPFLLRCIDVSSPWAVSLLLGALTALTGLYISMNCDFLNDLRFGHCRGLLLSDRSRCCGGTENVDHSKGLCKAAVLAVNATSNAAAPASVIVEWVPWEVVLPFPFLAYLLASLVPACLSAILVHSHAPAAKGSGIPDVKASVSGFVVTDSFTGVCLLVKALGLSLAVGAGLSLGKEGPLIHIGVCWAYVLHQHGGALGALAGTVPLYELVCTGAAAGVSTAFGAPVGGVLFAVEELGSLRALSQRALLLAFAGSCAACLLLKSWDLYGQNEVTFFNLSTGTNSPSKEWATWEIGPFLVLGALGGLVGSAFVRLNVWAVRRRRRSAEAGRLWLLPPRLQGLVLRLLPALGAHGARARHRLSDPPLEPLALHVLEVAVVAAGTAALNYPFTPLLRLPMVEVIRVLFETCPHSLTSHLDLCDASAAHGYTTGGSVQFSLLLAAVVRLLETAVTFGLQVPSGLFVPSLFIGAVLGRCVGLWTLSFYIHLFGEQSKTPISPPIFAMVGAVAMLSGFARMTVSLVVIMLELTGELNCAVPFMCAVLAAKLVGDVFSLSIYDAHATEFMGFAAIEEPGGLSLTSHIADIAVPCRAAEILDVSQSASTEALWAAFEAADAGDGQPAASWFVVVDGGAGGDVLGVLPRGRLRRWLERGGGAEPAPLPGNGAEHAPVSELKPQSLLEEGAMALLLASGPVLTAVCAFREHKRLQYCVCRSGAEVLERPAEPGASRLSVLTRDRLEAALRSGRYTPASLLASEASTEGAGGAAAAQRLLPPGGGPFRGWLWTRSLDAAVVEEGGIGLPLLPA